MTITRDFIEETIKKKILTLYINRYIGRWIQCKFNFVKSDAGLRSSLRRNSVTVVNRIGSA